MEALSLSTEGTSDAFDEVGKSAGEATIAIGQEVVGALTKALLAQEEFKDALRDGADELEEYVVNVSEVTEAMGSEEGADAYIEEIFEKVRQAKRELAEASSGIGGSSDLMRVAFADIDDALEELVLQNEAYKEELEDVILTQDAMAGVANFLGVELEELEGKISDVSDSTDDFRSVLTGFDDSAHRMQGTLYDLAETLIENEGIMDEFTQEGRANVEALSRAFDDLWSMSEGDAQEFAGNLAEAFAYLEGAEINLEDSTYMLFDAFTAAFGSEWHAHLDTTEAHKSVQHFLDAVIAALEARAELEREMAARYSTKSVGLDNWAAASGMDYRDNAAKFYRASAAAIEKQISAVKGLSSRLGEAREAGKRAGRDIHRSEEHTSELQSRGHLVCRLLRE